jgi:hypothetical protein
VIGPPAVCARHLIEPEKRCADRGALPDRPTTTEREEPVTDERQVTMRPPFSNPEVEALFRDFENRDDDDVLDGLLLISENDLATLFNEIAKLSALEAGHRAEARHRAGVYP